MKTIGIAASVMLAAFAGTVSDAVGQNVVKDLGGGTGVLVDGSDGGCGNLVFYSDLSYENGYSWSYGGVVAPDYGVFAECIPGPGKICSVVADLTRINDLGFKVDIFVYEDDGGLPGATVATFLDNDPGPVAFWPSVSRHSFPIDTECLSDPFYVAVGWSEGSTGVDELFIAADEDGPGGGCTLTKVAPGIGFPTGWNNVSVAWGPTAAIGVGAEVLACDPTPVIESGWGQIKALYK